MDLAPTVLSTGWASGVNAYATVALLGLLGRAGVGEVPEPLTSDVAIYGSALMYAIEFFTDKVPYLDNTWDAIHTLIRPAIASVIGVEFADADQVGTLDEALAGGGSGVTALTSHTIKASLRLAINTSPEPASNILASLIEDGLVALVVALALENPELAAAIVVVLLIAGTALVVFLWRRVRRAWRRMRERWRRGSGPGGNDAARAP